PTRSPSTPRTPGPARPNSRPAPYASNPVTAPPLPAAWSPLMDLRLTDAQPTAAERAAVDAVLGPPHSGWDGGERVGERDGHIALGGQAARARRPLLLPALHALQSSTGWISEGGLMYVCRRLSVPPAEAWGVEIGRAHV